MHAVARRLHAAALQGAFACRISLARDLSPALPFAGTPLRGHVAPALSPVFPFVGAPLLRHVAPAIPPIRTNAVAVLCAIFSLPRQRALPVLFVPRTCGLGYALAVFLVIYSGIRALALPYAITVLFVVSPPILPLAFNGLWGPFRGVVLSGFQGDPIAGP